MKLAYARTNLARWTIATLAVAGGIAMAQTPSWSPVDLVRQTVQNEIAASDGGAKFMFLDRKQTVHGSQTRLVVETTQAMAGMLVAVNEKPLTAEQRQAEESRLQRLVNNPEELRKKQRAEKDDSERITRIMRALPDAFLYEAEGTEVGQQGVGKAGDELVRLKFRPNPRFNPPSRLEQVLAGMQGYMLIDADKHRVARIDGTLVKDVSFGWGILGHLDKGGHFLVEQCDAGEGSWEITRMDLAFTGRELLFKSINIKWNEVFSDFRPVPSDLTFAKGVELLKKEEAELAENHQQNGNESRDPR